MPDSQQSVFSVLNSAETLSVNRASEKEWLNFMGSDIQSLAISAKGHDFSLNHVTGLLSPQFLYGHLNSREPLNKSMVSLRDLKRAGVRRGSPLMALVLNKIRNEADARFRACPTGLTGDVSLLVAPFRQAVHAFKEGRLACKPEIS